ncbi:pilin [Fluviicoccus keumensis]|nr:pilin [Fluviicoccus keumensis]
MKALVLLLMSGLLPGVAAADFYQCRQANGAMAFQDRPCTGSARPLKSRVDARRSAAKPAVPVPVAVAPAVTTTPPQRAAIAEGMALLAPVKVQLVEYYQSQGRFPASNAALGLPPANQYVRRAVIGLEVRPKGVLLVRFNGQSGVEGGEVRLQADVSKPHMGLGWECTTPSFRDIAEWAGSCRYTGN